jgi:hypothetical protein
MKTRDQKLSKADRDTSVRDLRAAGRSAADVIGEAAWRAKLAGPMRPLPAREAIELVAHRLAPRLSRG